MGLSLTFKYYSILITRHNAEEMRFFNTASSVPSSFQWYQNISIKPHTHRVYNGPFSSSFLVESEVLEESHI